MNIYDIFIFFPHLLDKNKCLKKSNYKILYLHKKISFATIVIYKFDKAKYGKRKLFIQKQDFHNGGPRNINWGG